MSGISPVSGTMFFGYVPAALPFAAPTPPATASSTSTPASSGASMSSSSTSASGTSTPAASSGTSTPPSNTSNTPSAADQAQLATLGLESSITTALFGAAPTDTTGTATFFSNARMYSLLGNAGGAVLGYLNAQSGASSSTTSSSTSTPAADTSTTTPAPVSSSTVDTTA